MQGQVASLGMGCSGEQGEGLSPCVVRLPGLAELADWAHNLQAEFIAWLLNAPSTREEYSFP